MRNITSLHFWKTKQWTTLALGSGRIAGFDIKKKNMPVVARTWEKIRSIQWCCWVLYQLCTKWSTFHLQNMFKLLFVTFLCLPYFVYIRIIWLGQLSLDSGCGVGPVWRVLFLDHWHSLSNGSFQYWNIEDIKLPSVIRQIYCALDLILSIMYQFQTSARSCLK